MPDCVAERGGFEPSVPLAFIRVAFGPSLAPYSGAEGILSNSRPTPIVDSPVTRFCSSYSRPGVEASRDRDTSTEQRGTRHYVVVWLFRNRYRQFESTSLRHTVWHASLHYGEAMKSARGARFTRGRGRGECQRQRLSVKIA